MRIDKTLVVARREYLTRVKSKGFWIGTIVLPVFILAVTVVPALVMSKTKTTHRMVVVDETGSIADPLARELTHRETGDGEAVNFQVKIESPSPDPAAQRKELDRQVLNGEINSWLWVTPDGLAENEVEYHAENISNFVTQEVLTSTISRVVRRARLIQAGYDPNLIQELDRSVDLRTVRLSEKGSREEAGEAGFVFAYLLFFLLYMVLIIYGQHVMQGVLEEKTSRVVELVVSSVRPVELMMGKMTGICLVGLTQLVIWLGTVAIVTAPVVVASLTWIPAGFHVPTLAPSLVIHFFVLFLLGFFLYSSFYAAVGASFNSAQEAQQLAGVALIFFFTPFVFLMPVVNDPDSTLAVVLSLIPVFTPLLMMLRIAVKSPPLWQILLSYVLTGVFTLFLIWGAARIYRVGILMYGKKPTVREILRWARHA